MSKIQLNSDFIIIFREMRANALRTLVNNPLKKKTINILIAFFISHKNYVKNFLKWIINHYPKSTY